MSRYSRMPCFSSLSHINARLMEIRIVEGFNRWRCLVACGEWRVVDWCRGWSLHPAALGRRVTLNCDDARSAVKELINVAVPRSWPHATYKHTFPILFGWVAADWIAKGKMAGLWRVHSPDASIRFVAARRGKSGLALRGSLCNPQLVNADNLHKQKYRIYF